MLARGEVYMSFGKWNCECINNDYIILIDMTNVLEKVRAYKNMSRKAGDIIVVFSPSCPSPLKSYAHALCRTICLLFIHGFFFFAYYYSSSVFFKLNN